MLNVVEPPRSKATNAYDLLNDVARAITEEPKRIAMAVVCFRGRALDRLVRWNYRVSQVPACETVGCIAGWTEVLTGRTDPNESNNGGMFTAGRLLGLNSRQADVLFLDRDLVSANNQQTHEHARAVVRHIRKFQQKYADQLKAKAIE